MVTTVALPRHAPGRAAIHCIHHMKIDVTKKFPHLRKAPVVEAVIEFRARTIAAWDETATAPRLKQAIAGEYPNVQTMQTFSLRASFALNSAAPPPEPPPPAEHSAGWGGLRFTNSDSTQVAIFKREGFTFSRLRPYTRWNRVTRDALRLWAIQAEVSGATQIERIGVRFINRLEVPTQGLKFNRYFTGFGSVPGGLPLSNFVNHRTIEVPGHPYNIVLTQTTQPPTALDSNTIGLITDIDVMSPHPIVNDRRIIVGRLEEMRFLKNTVFFGSVTKQYLALCQ